MNILLTSLFGKHEDTVCLIYRCFINNLCLFKLIFFCWAKERKDLCMHGVVPGRNVRWIFFFTSGACKGFRLGRGGILTPVAFFICKLKIVLPLYINIKL